MPIVSLTRCKILDKPRLSRINLPIRAVGARLGIGKTLKVSKVPFSQGTLGIRPPFRLKPEP